MKELEDLFKSVNKGGYFRCSICNCVSNESIETNLGDYRPHQSFTNDPKDKLHFICIDCYESIEDIKEEFKYKDEYLDGELS